MRTRADRGTPGKRAPERDDAVGTGTSEAGGLARAVGRGCGVDGELAAILTRIAAGDRPALKALYDRFGARLYGVARRILRDQALAEDAVQEAFVKIWRNAGKFDPARGSAVGWVVIIARRAAFDLRPREPVGEPIEIPAEQPEPEMLHPGLTRALEALPEMHRKALLLMYVYGLTHSELSATLGAPLGTVKSWVRRGAAALKEALGDD